MKKKRILAFFIDVICVTFVLCPLVLIFSHSKVLTLIISGLWGGVFFNKDILRGQSIGKKVLKIRIVDVNTQREPTIVSLFLRNVFYIFWPLDIIVMLFNSHRKIGDYIVGTEVINSFNLGKKLEKQEAISIVLFILLTILIVCLLLIIVAKIDPKLDILFTL